MLTMMPGDHVTSKPKNPDVLRRLICFDPKDRRTVELGLTVESRQPFRLELLSPLVETSTPLAAKNVINDIHARKMIPAGLIEILSAMLDKPGLIFPGREYPLLGLSSVTAGDPKVVKVVVDEDRQVRVIVEHCKKRPSKVCWDLHPGLFFPAVKAA